MAMTATTLDNIKVMYPNLLDQYELRKGQYAMLNKAIQNTQSGTGVVSADLVQKARQSWGRAIDIPVMTSAASALGTGIACTAVGTDAISAFASVAWVNVSVAWTMAKTRNDQNEISYRQEYARKFTDSMDALYNNVDQAIDTSLIAALAAEAEYNNGYIGLGNKYGAFVADRLQCSLALRPGLFNDYTSIQKSDNIYGRMDVIGSTNLESIVRELGAQGVSNDTNTQYQFGNYDFNFSNNVTQGAATDATAYIVPKGSFGIIFRNAPDPMRGEATTTGKVFGTMPDSVLGTNVDYMYYSDCADINALTGNALDIAAVQEVHQVSVSYGIIMPYSNFATSGVGGVIRAVDFLTA
jgi:hypothetical protein